MSHSCLLPVSTPCLLPPSNHRLAFKHCRLVWIVFEFYTAWVILYILSCVLAALTQHHVSEICLCCVAMVYSFPLMCNIIVYWSFPLLVNIWVVSLFKCLSNYFQCMYPCTSVECMCRNGVCWALWYGYVHFSCHVVFQSDCTFMLPPGSSRISLVIILANTWGCLSFRF